MEQLFFLLIPLFASSSIISAGNDPSIPTTVPPNTTAMSPWSVVSRTEVQTEKTVSTTTAPVYSSHTGSTDGSGLSSHNTSVGVSLLPKTSTTANSNISMSEVTATPSQAPDSGLTLLAFGVMSLILILIVVMVVLVTAINLRGRCRNTKQHEGIKSCDSVVSDSNMTSNCEKESITLVSVRTINTENNTDSPQMSSVRSTIVDNDDQEFTRDLLGIKDGL
ncbi:endothelial cell-specific chemotaxis regulator isoform X4 [Sinocyclocheilus rhinocerous]|uniref:endothelial cell-specific chemotaxis regulator isoform X4 n=1 Tax=Sinocyclocheilus rhinocerous TaxID=307959 RepID=UPI0007B96AB4|nr:PREDICTED: endothelial cell-specific chemotaxis regulator-like isoform X4 [Sinocyclocheilus rhinocerous]